MNSAEAELIVFAVQKRPGLFDKTNKLYANRQYNIHAWKEISEETQIEENLAKKKWGNLRDYFQRQHRDLLTAKSGSAPSKKKKWALYDSMSFLIPYLSDRTTSGNLDDASATAASSECGDTEDTQQIAFSPASQSPGAHSPSPSASTENSERASSSQLSLKRTFPTRRNEVRNNIDVEILETLKAMPAARKEKNEEDDDEDYMFFKNLVPKMKCLNDIQKLELQAEINSVFLKHLKRARSTKPCATESTKPYI